MRESKETKCKKADALKIVCDVHTRNRFPIVSQTITTAQRRERDKRELGETHVDLLSREDQRKQGEKKIYFQTRIKMIVVDFSFLFLRNVCCWELLRPVFIDYISRWEEGYG